MSISNQPDIAMEYEDHELPDDYVSPRTKIARMLAEVDDKPTPLNSPEPILAKNGSRSEPKSPTPTQRSSQISRSPSIGQASSEDDDILPRRPAGNVVRRMFQQGKNKSQGAPRSSPPAIDHDDLYSASPDAIRAPVAFPRRSPTPLQRGQGLFVSPAKSNEDASDDDLPVNPIRSNAKLEALIAAKRAERLDKERADKEQREEQTRLSSDLPEEIVEDEAAPVNPDLEKILSDAARPTRKASKRAMLEMERETQRLAREQALTHQMKTKKKFSTSDLFARFQFRQSAPLTAIDTNVTPASSSSPARQSDSPGLGRVGTLQRESASTPPSSPPTPWDRQKAIVERGALARMTMAREDSLASLASGADVNINEDEELPDLEDIIKQSQAAKAIAVQQAPESPSRSAARKNAIKTRKLPQPAEDDDTELEIMPKMPAHLRMFDRVKPVSKSGPAHSKAIHVLKHLAHLNQDSTARSKKKSVKPFVAPDVVNAQLLAHARAQAKEAQQERLAELKAKGVVILSAEEQENEAEQMENLLEKARQEAEELRKKERAAARLEAGENAVVASDDESEDADFEDDDDELAEEASEDEIEDDLIDGAAAESDGSEEEAEIDQEEDLLSHDGNAEDNQTAVTIDQAAKAQSPPTDHPTESVFMGGKRKGRKALVIQDEDDEVEEEHVQDTPATSTADPFAAFGFGNNNGPQLMSPTQAFNATMETPSQFTQRPNETPRVSYFNLARDVSAPPVSVARSRSVVLAESQTQLVPSSQVIDQTQDLDLDFETLPETPLAVAKAPPSFTMETPGWEPSQDAGLPSPWTAARGEAVRQYQAGLAVEHETQSTVRMRISESPEVVMPRKKGRLTKGMRMVQEEAPADNPRNAFSEMQRKRMEGLNALERAQAEKEARNMMDEQAEESEDEYAGLGGDDTNMIAPETEEDREMIDETEQNVDERALAQFYAERQRVAEEEATSKLYKDLTTGALRRRQGVGWELDEDEDELAARRRQIRQREEARKRKLLLEDENVKGLLESKGNSKAREAFLRTIEDGDEIEIEDQDVAEVEATQEETQTQDAPLQETSGNKRSLPDATDRPVSKVRRVNYESNAFTKPTSMLQVRESLSFLLDEPENMSFGPSFMDENEHEPDDDESEAEPADDNGGSIPDQEAMPPPPLPTERLPAAQRRTPAKPAVIDRLNLRRSSSSGSTSSNGWSAWSTGSQSKVPSLLRKATSNLSAASTNDRGVSYGNGSTERAVKTGGSKKSSLAYQARAEERRAVAERAEKKREEGRRSMAQMRREQGGALSNGAFGARWE